MPVKTKIAEQIMSEIDTYLQKKDDLDMIMNLSHNKKEREQLSVDKAVSYTHLTLPTNREV